MDWDVHFTFLNGHFRSRSIRYKGIWLYLLCHCTPWLNRQAYFVPTMLAPQWNYRMCVVYLTELPGDILNLSPYIFDDNEREGRIMLLLELMEVEITSFDCSAASSTETLGNRLGTWYIQTRCKFAKPWSEKWHFWFVCKSHTNLTCYRFQHV